MQWIMICLLHKWQYLRIVDENGRKYIEFTQNVRGIGQDTIGAFISTITWENGKYKTVRKNVFPGGRIIILC